MKRCPFAALYHYCKHSTTHRVVHVVLEISEGHLRLDHPELRQVSCRLAVLGAEGRAESVYVTQCTRVSLSGELVQRGRRGGRRRGNGGDGWKGAGGGGGGGRGEGGGNKVRVSRESLMTPLRLSSVPLGSARFS